MIDVVGIGSSLYDLLMVTDDYPVEDSKIESSMTLIQGGGPCATALVSVAKLGCTAAYLGAVGDDYFGSHMMAELRSYGVDTSSVCLQEGKISAHAVVTLNKKNGLRTCVWSKGTVDALTRKDVDKEIIRGAKVLHLDGHHLEAAIYAAEIAREHGVKVSLDAGSKYPGIEQLLPLVDFLIPSESFTLAVTGESDPEVAAYKLFELYQPQILVVTQGARGGFIYNGRVLKRYPAFEVEVADSNGAGDVFHGAFIVGFLKGMSFQECAHFASSVSALKCRGLGARRSLPTYEQAMRFMETHRY